MVLISYRKWQKLGAKKFCSSLEFIQCRKIFAVFASSVWEVLKKAIAKLNIHGRNFHDSWEIHKNCKTFSHPTFVVYGITLTQNIYDLVTWNAIAFIFWDEITLTFIICGTYDYTINRPSYLHTVVYKWLRVIKSLKQHLSGGHGNLI